MFELPAGRPPKKTPFERALERAEKARERFLKEQEHFLAGDDGQDAIRLLMWRAGRTDYPFTSGGRP